MTPSNDDKPKRRGTYVGVGIALGTALGAAMDNLGLGLALGIALGAAYESGGGKRARVDPDRDLSSGDS